MYDDAYGSCERTFATVRIYPGDIDPSEVTERLGIEPSKWQRRGEVVQRGRFPPRVVSLNGWFLRSEGHVESRDSRRHIDWLLDRLTPKAEAVRSLQDAGCRMDVSCFWASRQGQGGPTVSPQQMKRLSDLNIELWFDFYCAYEESDAEAVPDGSPSA
jgi:Domain of unknown function (DUF4279)